MKKTVMWRVKKNVAKSIAVVVVALPTFAYHWRKVEKEKNEQK